MIELLFTVTVVNNGESVIWRRRHYLFTVAETGRGIIYGGVFFSFFFVSSRKDKMRAWFGTSTAGQKGQTRGPASAREADVRQEAKDAASCLSIIIGI